MYTINPVKATYSIQNRGIQTMNDTCFGVCAAFSGTYDTYAMDPQCTQACTDLIEKRKHEIFGVGSCDHQVPYRPVFWDQVPHYVPKLLKNGNTPEQARNKCLQLCESVNNLVEECKEKCEIDFNAIETYTSPSSVSDSETKPEETKPKTKKDNTIIIFIFILFLIVLIPYFLSK